MFTPIGHFITAAPAAPFTQESVRFDGTNYLTRSGALDSSNQKNNLFFFAGKQQTVDNRETIFSWDGTSGCLRFWNTLTGTVQLRVQSSTYETSEFLAGHSDTFLQILVETKDDGASGMDIDIWALVAGEAWASVLTTNVASSSGIAWAGKASAAIGSETGIAQFLDGYMTRLAVWTGLGSTPDITLPATRDLFSVDGTTIEDPATATASLGTPKIDFNGPASEYNSGTHDGSLTGWTPFTADFTDE